MSSCLLQGEEIVFKIEDIVKLAGISSLEDQNPDSGDLLVMHTTLTL
jgi:hypothetical protein